METPHQSLLNNPPNKKSSKLTKLLCLVVLSLGVFIGTIGLLANVNLKFFSYNTLSLSHVCGNAHDPKSCMAMVSEVASNGVLQANDVGPLRTFLETSIIHVENAMKIPNDMKRKIHGTRHHAAIEVCKHLFGLSKERLMGSLEALGDGKLGSNYHDVHTWLSAVLTNHFTCLDGLEGPARPMWETRIHELIARARASLAMLVALSPNNYKQQIDVIKPLKDKFPVWLTSRDRKLLETSAKDINADVVVAKDGSGDYTTVVDAIASAPNKSETRYVIYVKEGTYVETVRIISNKWNIMLVGDGMDSTIITGSLNFVDGTGTFNTPTVAVEGDGFIGQDIWFQNTAGPEKNQAVALRVSADKSVINRCQIDAYQDTLYPHTNNQFYRDSQIIGTIDFIFGNAGVVLQNCTIIARRPMDGQSNMVTAQGRDDPNQNTGTSIQMCRIVPSSDLKPVQDSIRTYLGRPWRTYSRTVIMQSYIEDHIDPSGWHQWDDTTDFEALYYGEYSNDGPGSYTDNRVDWPGFHVITDPNEAMPFTVAELIQGGSWLESTGVDYIEGLSL